MKKLLLVLFLSAGATTFASSGKVVKLKNASKPKVSVVVLEDKKYNCETSCDGVTFTFQANTAAEAVSIALRYCSGGVIKMTKSLSAA